MKHLPLPGLAGQSNQAKMPSSSSGDAAWPGTARTATVQSGSAYLSWSWPPSPFSSGFISRSVHGHHWRRRHTGGPHCDRIRRSLPQSGSADAAHPAHPAAPSPRARVSQFIPRSSCPLPRRGVRPISAP